MTARTFVDPFDPLGQVLVPWTNDPNATPRTLEDRDTLARGRGLSRSARVVARRPRAFVADESGFLPNGSWTPGSAA